MKRLKDWLRAKVRDVALTADFELRAEIKELIETVRLDLVTELSALHFAVETHKLANSEAITTQKSDLAKLRSDMNSGDSAALVKADEMAQACQHTVKAMVMEELARAQSHKTRHIACPTCGKSFNLHTLGLAYHTRSATIACDNCGQHFEIRPGLFWEKIEVERR